jgi:membrane protein
MLVDFGTPIGWSELFRRTYREMLDDNGLGLAAQLAFYFFLSLFPTLLFLLAIASYLPADDLTGRVVGVMQGAAPDQVVGIIRTQLEHLGARRDGGVLTFGVVFALWSSSAALVAIIDALNRAYDVTDTRSWWKRRAVALLLTIGLAAFLLLSFALVMGGPALGRFVGGYFGLDSAFATAWSVLYWPVVFMLVATGIGLVYFFAPNVKQPFAWLTPGSVLAAVLWIGGSLGFRTYVANFGSYNESYGAIGGVMVLLLWLYLSGLVLLLGAELNSEIVHARVAATQNQPARGKSGG